MKPSEICKLAGLSGLGELSDLTEQSVQTLNNWHKHKTALFEIVVAGAVAIKTNRAGIFDNYIDVNLRDVNQHKSAFSKFPD